MHRDLQPYCLPLLIGSLPLRDHSEATDMVLKYTPELPLWVQLPVYPQEGMMQQFLPGMPGYSQQEGSFFVNKGSQQFDSDLVAFYEEYLAVTQSSQKLQGTRFVLDKDIARGFYVLLDKLKRSETAITAVKGQITGPVTYATGVKDQEKRAIFYDEQLRDAAVKLLSLKAAWQAEELSQLGAPVVIFFDEPALAGFGSSEFISISKQEVLDCFKECIEQVHARGALAGIHVCANADWSLILDSEADILSFDAYSYFDRLLIYGTELQKFLESKGYIAWGIVPTQDPENIDAETADSLLNKFEYQLQQLEDKTSVEKDRLLARSFITPSCGTGSLDIKHAEKVLSLTRSLSDKIRNRMDLT